MSEKPGFSTRSIHATLAREAYDASTALSPPIATASTFRTPVDYVLDSGSDYVYGRYGNASRNGLEAVVAAMEGAKHSLIFSSGKPNSYLGFVNWNTFKLTIQSYNQ